MAQVVNATPVVLENDNSTQFFANTLANVAEEKRKRQFLMQQQLLKQREANDKIFGDQVKNLQEWSAASKLPTVERDRILNEAVVTLAQNKNRPDFQAVAPVLATKAFQAYKGWDKYYGEAESTINDLAQRFNADPAKLKQFALANIYDYKQEGQDNTNIIEGYRSGVIQPPAGMTVDQAISEAQSIRPKTVQKLKDAAQMMDAASTIQEEFNAHPELYIDRNKVNTGAFAEIDKTFKALQPKGDKLSLDPTGFKVTKIGTEYTLSPFESEVEFTDKETGLKYKKPVLKTEQTTVITKPDGKPYSVLSEDAYEAFVGGDNKNIRQAVYTTALDKIREHNEQAFEKAGFTYPKATALAVSRNNASQFNTIPGYVNPFDDAALEVFQRAAAVDLLNASGRYDDKGEVVGFKLDRGIDKNRPNVTNVYNNIGEGKGFIDAFSSVDEMATKKFNEGKKYTQVNLSPYSDVIIDYAQDALGVKNLNSADLQIVKDKDGNVGIYAARDIKGKPTLENPLGQPIRKAGLDGAALIAYIDRDKFNILANNSLGQKAKGSAAASDEPAKKVYNPKTGKFE